MNTEYAIEQLGKAQEYLRKGSEEMALDAINRALDNFESGDYHVINSNDFADRNTLE